MRDTQSREWKSSVSTVNVSNTQSSFSVQKQLLCIGCHVPLAPKAFSRNQQLKQTPKCKACVDRAKSDDFIQPRLKCCVQCFQKLPKPSFSKRQAQLLDPKCKKCVEKLECAAAASSEHASHKWKFDQYYRVCHRGKSGGVSVRISHNIASPILGYIPLGRVFRATTPICNDQGDPMVRLKTPHFSSAIIRNDSAQEGNEAERQYKEAWVPCRSLRNEILLEPHQGPFISDGMKELTCRYFRCVVEGCKVRGQANLSMQEIGYVLYGDVIEVVESTVVEGGIVFLRLHERYFDGMAWVVERSLDNESVLSEVEGPWTSLPTHPRKELYRCVQDTGAPIRMEPELTAPPVGRIPCGTVMTIVERTLTKQRQIFLRIMEVNTVHPNEKDTQGDKWVIETSSCCASVMVKVT